MFKTVYNRNILNRNGSIDIRNNTDPSVREITSLEIQVTNMCNLACTYCFQRNKSNHTLLPHEYKRILDILFNDEPDSDKFETFKIKEGRRGYFFLYFIGGEPLLKIKDIRYFIYLFEEKLEEHNMKDLKWKIGFTSNGTLFFDKDVQDFYKEYKDRIWMVTSIDGYSSESNDICRKFKNGKGTFDVIKKTLDYLNANKKDDNKVKMKYVISKANLKYLYMNVVKMIKNGYTYIHTGLVEEDNWTTEDARLYYEQLSRIIDYVIYNVPELRDNFDLNTISKHISTNRFYTHEMLNDEYVKPCSIFYKEKLTISATGDFIPCMALDESSSGDQVLMSYGNIYTGELQSDQQKSIYNFLYGGFKLRDFYTYKCANCPCNMRCGGCPGIMYSKIGKIQMCESACEMHIAEYLAHTKYYNMLCLINKKYISNNPMDGNLLLPEDICVNIIGFEEYSTLIALINGRILSNG